MDGRSDRRTDRAEFIRASSEARGPIKYMKKKTYERIKRTYNDLN